jgi:hypothetical protein
VFTITLSETDSLKEQIDELQRLVDKGQYSQATFDKTVAVASNLDRQGREIAKLNSRFSVTQTVNEGGRKVRIKAQFGPKKSSGLKGFFAWLFPARSG